MGKKWELWQFFRSRPFWRIHIQTRGDQCHGIIWPESFWNCECFFFCFLPFNKWKKKYLCYQLGNRVLSPVGWLFETFVPLNIGFFAISSLCLGQRRPSIIGSQLSIKLGSISWVTETFSDVVYLVYVRVAREDRVSSQHLSIQATNGPYVNLEIWKLRIKIS